MLPIFAKEFNHAAPPYGGWIAGLLNELKECEDIDITVCFSAGEEKQGIVEGINYFGYKRGEDNIAFFENLINKANPDLIHIWGTENKHSNEMI